MVLEVVHVLHREYNSFSQCYKLLTMRKNYSCVLRFCSFEGLKHLPQVQCNKPVGQYLAHDGHCIFTETSPKSNNSIFPKLWMVFLGFFNERIEFPCLLLVDDDRFCSGLCSERMHQNLNLGHSSLIFKCSILWYFLHTEIDFKVVSLNTRVLGCCTSLSCCTCQAFFQTTFG